MDASFEDGWQKGKIECKVRDINQSHSHYVKKSPVEQCDFTTGKQVEKSTD